jgi:hypothetical protein
MKPAVANRVGVSARAAVMKTIGEVMAAGL